MAGKPKNSGWGGKRANQTGRPRQKTTISERQKKKWLKAAKAFAKKHGMSVEEAVLEMIKAPDVQDSVRVAAAKLYVEATVAKETVKDVNVSTVQGPVIGLPPKREDPALKVVGGKDK